MAVTATFPILGLRGVTERWRDVGSRWKAWLKIKESRGLNIVRMNNNFIWTTDNRLAVNGGLDVTDMARLTIAGRKKLRLQFKGSVGRRRGVR